MAHAVSWFQITGKDGKKLQAFYKKVFAWKAGGASYGDMMMVAREKDGISGGIGSSHDGNSHVAIYINVDDLHAHLSKIEAAGGETMMPPTELPGGMGIIAGFHDPAGNWLGLWQPAPARKAATKPAKSAAKKARTRTATKPAAKKSAGKRAGKRR